ncbi:hypothetical protein [Candidatus Colwellia aromaticivorans]|uniref:hypothetical protein n=1 Tax=Candidatus Colwellia aromaticivorans TaxID=2267621 RepID=UPI001443E78D|nr:hypothetical protein [Candidatus Colwellia aromaticivorans]
MNMEDYERFNELSQKALKDFATQSEFLEFKQLLLSWNSSIDYNFYTPPDIPEPE